MDNTTSSTQSVTNAPAASSPPTGSYIPASQTGLMLKAFLLLIELDNEMQKLFAEVQKEYALAYGGSKDGKTIDSTGNSGLLKMFYTALVDAGEKQADSIRMEATGHFISAGGSGLALGSMYKSGMRANTERAPIQKQLDVANQYKTQLEKPLLPEANIVAQARQNPQEYMHVGQRADEIKAGQNINTFKPDRDGPAIEMLKLNQAEKTKASTEVQKHIKFLEEQKATPATDHNSRVQTYNQAAHAGSSVGTGATSLVKADDTAEAAQKSAEAEVLKTVQGQVSSSEEKAREQAAAKRHSAEGWAEAIGQTRNVQV